MLIFFLFLQDGVYRENRTSILRETVHNLGLSEETGALWMIDNESAFLDGYSLMYSSDGDDSSSERHLAFHESMLRTTCVFRRRTVDRLFALHGSPDPARLLLRFVGESEPLFAASPRLPTIHANSVFSRHFADRVARVWQWVRGCQERLQGSSDSGY